MRKHTLFTLGVLLALVLGACAPTPTPAPPAPTAAPTDTPVPPTPTEAPPKPVTLRVGAKCGPSPHAMPLFVVLARTGGQLDGVTIEYVPVTEPAQMAALLGTQQVDAMVGFIVQTANIFQKGEVRNLRLVSVPLWKGFYVVAGEDVQSWDDLKGQRILMPNPQSGPAQLGRASMKQAGLDPETDFTVENLPAPQIVQMMITGKAAAAVVSEPFVTIMISKAKQEGTVTLKPAPISLYAVYKAEAWPEGQLPIEGFLTVQQVLDDEAMAAALKKFEAAYYEAIDFMLANPAEASQLIVSQLTVHCDSKMQPKPLENALSAGRLLYDPRPVGELLPDLDTYIEQMTHQEVDDSFYAQP